MAIDIGPGAVFGDGSWPALYTVVDKHNAANASGTITSVEIWTGGNITGCIVGTFYTTNGNTLKCRDSAVIGVVEAGEKRTFTEDSEGVPLAIEVMAGDYIGMYFATSTVRCTSSGFTGLWYINAEHIDPNDEATYTLLDDYAVSLAGTGEEAGGTIVPKVTHHRKQMGVE